LFLIFAAGSAALNALVKSDYFSGYLSMNIVLMTAFGFVLLREVPVNDRAYQLLAPLSRASFGIYLAHVIVLALLEQSPVVGMWFSAGNSAYMIPLLGLLGFLVSFVLVTILQKIPFLRWITP
ncbi:MAG: acyltransferase family protein, partial [Chloroflexi bacterium]|nr:acyltransferase family protein [Chloroflexota bacterium]